METPYNNELLLVFIPWWKNVEGEVPAGGRGDSDFSCKVFPLENVVKMSKSILESWKSEAGSWKTGLVQPRFRLPVSDFRLHMKLLMGIKCKL